MNNKVPEALLVGIGDALGKVRREMDETIALLSERVNALEARPVIKYCGLWSADDQYNQGHLVTRAGSVWHCDRSTRTEPGKSEDWTLAVKRGRDGKEAR